MFFTVADNYSKETKIIRNILAFRYSTALVLSVLFLILILTIGRYFVGYLYSKNELRNKKKIFNILNILNILNISNFAREPFKQINLYLFIPIIFTIGIICSICQTRNDAMFLIKRLGRCSASLFPLTLFLTSKPSFLPYTIYLILLPIHKWISRLLVILGLIHSILYLIIFHFYRSNGLLAIFHWSHFAGFLVIIFLLIITISSLPLIRGKNYRLFYGLHYPLACLIIPLLYIHSNPSIPIFTLSSISIIIWQILYNFFFSKKIIFKNDQLLKFNSIIILKLSRSNFPTYFDPGVHIRLAESVSQNDDGNNKNYFKKIIHFIISVIYPKPSHPYTVCSLPSDDEIILAIRIHSKKSFNPSTNILYNIYGPYNSLPFNFLNSCENLFIIVNGIGITFGAPIAKYACLKSINSITITWIIRNSDDLILLDYLSIDSSLLNFNIFITQDNYSSSRDIPLQEIKSSKKNNKLYAKYNDKTMHELINIKNGRPNISHLISEWHVSKHELINSSWVIACGSDSLIQSARAGAKKKNLSFHGEFYKV